MVYGTLRQRNKSSKWSKIITLFPNNFLFPCPYSNSIKPTLKNNQPNRLKNWPNICVTMCYKNVEKEKTKRNSNSFKFLLVNVETSAMTSPSSQSALGKTLLNHDPPILLIYLLLYSLIFYIHSILSHSLSPYFAFNCSQPLFYINSSLKLS